MNTRLALAAAASLVGVSALVFGVGPMSDLIAASPDGTILDTDPRPADATLAWLAALGDEARALYFAHLRWDVLFLSVHAMAMFVLIALPLRGRPMAWRWLAWIPLLAGALDVAENLLVWRLLSVDAAADGVRGAATAVRIVTEGKLGLVLATFAALAGAWASVVVLSIKRRLVGDPGARAEASTSS